MNLMVVDGDIFVCGMLCVIFIYIFLFEYKVRNCFRLVYGV